MGELLSVMEIRECRAEYVKARSAWGKTILISRLSFPIQSIILRTRTLLQRSDRDDCLSFGPLGTSYGCDFSG